MTRGEGADDGEHGSRDCRRVVAGVGRAAVDVRTDRYELSLPPKLTFGQIKGFTLYATRTILSGEGEELVELTKTNLRDLGDE
jgi:pyruvate dehydrogenase (quinone)